MVSLLQALWRKLNTSTPRLVCPRPIWIDGVTELKNRAAGRIESGAFLLGKTERGIRYIEKFVFYDDLDPTCFDNKFGIVEFDGRNFGKLWAMCRELSMTVVADVHVHPGHYGQSPSDQQNPMIAEAGHLALILPHFAARQNYPGSMGIYEYRGGRKWLDHSLLGKNLFFIGWWPK